MMTSSREEELRQDIERTREQLGDTVEALAHKVDVAARVKETVQVKTEEIKQQAQAKAEEVTQQVLQGTEALHTTAAEVAQRAEQLTDQALEKLPPPVAARIEPLIDTPSNGRCPQWRSRWGCCWCCGWCCDACSAGKGEEAMLKMLYKPLGLLISVTGGIAAGALSTRV